MTIGLMFHQSVLFILIAGLCALIPLNIYIKTRLAPIVFVGFIIFTFFSVNFVFVYIEQILNLVGLTKYANYFNNTRHFIPYDYGSGLGILIKIFFSIYVIFNTRQFILINQNYWILIILTFIYSVALILANNIVIFTRMVDTFTIVLIIDVFLLYKLQKNKVFNHVILIVFLFFLILSFIKSGMGIETSYADPKRNPYKTILME